MLPNSPPLIFLHLLLLLLSRLVNANPNVTSPKHNNTSSPLSFLAKLDDNISNGQNPNNNAIFPFQTKKDGSNIQNRYAQALSKGSVSDCWWRPWMCRQGLPPIVPILCCNNQCVNVRCDRKNCGLCGVRCMNGWKCCHGVCVDVMISPLHCGDCNRRCRFPSLCFEGTCRPITPKPPCQGKPLCPSPPKPPKPPCQGKPICPLPPKPPKPPCSRPPFPSPPKCPKPPIASLPEHVRPPRASPPKPAKPPRASPPKQARPPRASPPEHVRPPHASPPKHARPPHAS